MSLSYDDTFINLFDMRGTRQCEQQAVEDAVAHVDQPLPTQLYDKRFPEAPLSARVSVTAPYA